jgi:hypothetical protein
MSKILNSAVGGLGLSGALSARKLTVADKRKMVDRHVRRWRFVNFWKVRVWEAPTWVFLFVVMPLVRACLRMVGLQLGVAVMYSELRCVKWDSALQMSVDYGVVGRHLVVTAGKNYIAGTFNSVNEPESMKFHGYGTGSTAAALGDTGLVTELTTQYNPDNTRITGSQANSTNTYTTVGTVTPDASVTLQEWGLFSASSAGTLLDRQTYTGIALNGTGDSLQTTYVLTIS